MLQLVSQNDPMLRGKTKRVEEFDDRTRRLVSNMKKTMEKEHGIGLAAPQIGKSLQVFVVDTRFIRKSEEHKGMSKIKRVAKKLFKKKMRETFINPEVLYVPEEKFLAEEGCLSVPKVFGAVLRAKKITVAAQDEYGKKFKINATDLYAHVLQHEIDHLGGVLFTEKTIKGSLHKIKNQK